LRRIKKPKLIQMIANEEPDKTLELEGMALDNKYVLAVPETAGARLTLWFLESSRRKPS